MCQRKSWLFPTHGYFVSVAHGSPRMAFLTYGGANLFHHVEGIDHHRFAEIDAHRINQFLEPLLDRRVVCARLLPAPAVVACGLPILAERGRLGLGDGGSGVGVGGGLGEIDALPLLDECLEIH